MEKVDIMEVILAISHLQYVLPYEHHALLRTLELYLDQQDDTIRELKDKIDDLTETIASMGQGDKVMYVRCVKSRVCWWSEGKIYPIINGVIVDNEGDTRVIMNESQLEQYNSPLYTFEVIKE